jgi:hypothetical protein
LGDTGQLRGVLFEKFAHTVIGAGGLFNVRNLQTQEKSILSLSKDLTTVLFSNKLQIQGADNSYFRPVSKNFESVDSFIKPNLLFQMTSAKSHPCKQIGIRDVLTILDNPSNPEFYFVVPPDCFDTFTAQNYHGIDGEVLAEKGILKAVKQFVLSLPLTSN